MFEINSTLPTVQMLPAFIDEHLLYRLCYRHRILSLKRSNPSCPQRSRRTPAYGLRQHIAAIRQGRCHRLHSLRVVAPVLTGRRYSPACLQGRPLSILLNLKN